MTNNRTPDAIHPDNIDKQIYDLYDEYCHSSMSRREFLEKAGAMTIAGVSGLAMAQSLLPRYAQAQTISFTDERIKATYIDYESPGGTSGEMRGAALKAGGKTFERHLYDGTRHGFHNNSTPRFNKEAAALAESRTLEFFTTHLSG